MPIAPAPFRDHRCARGGARIVLTCLTLRRSTAVNDLGGEEVKNLTPNFGPHPDSIATRGRLACSQTPIVRDVASRSSDLDDLDVDRELRVVWAMLSPRCGPGTAPVAAWRGVCLALDICEPLPIAIERTR